MITDNLFHVTLKIVLDGREYRGGKDFNNEKDACKYLEELQDRFYDVIVQELNGDCSEERADYSPDFNLYWFLLTMRNLDHNKYRVEGWVELDDERFEMPDFEL